MKDPSIDRMIIYKRLENLMIPDPPEINLLLLKKMVFLTIINCFVAQLRLSASTFVQTYVRTIV